METNREVAIDITIPVVALTIILVCLKLTGVSDVSWGWTLFPLMLFPIIVVAFLLLMLVFFLLVLFMAWTTGKPSPKITFKKKGG